MIFLFCLHDAPYYTGAPLHLILRHCLHRLTYLSTGLQQPQLYFLAAYLSPAHHYFSQTNFACILVTTVDARVSRILNFLDIISCTVFRIYISM